LLHQFVLSWRHTARGAALGIARTAHRVVRGRRRHILRRRHALPKLRHEGLHVLCQLLDKFVRQGVLRLLGLGRPIAGRPARSSGLRPRQRQRRLLKVI